MAGRPSGTVTFLFTDVEGSTSLVKRLGGGYGEILAEHQRILRDAFVAVGGVEVDTQGDAFFYVFSRAHDAAEGAAARTARDPLLDRQIAQGLAEQATNPDAARGLWERVDRQTVDKAQWVSLVNPKVVEVVSQRVGNYQYSPNGYGMLTDQLWVR